MQTNRTEKYQQMREMLAISVAHYPPATSKWNKIEHRLFSFIPINWRDKPLTSLEVMLELISHTTTKEGLTVTALKDNRTYPTGMKISDEELDALHLLRDAFHDDIIPHSLFLSTFLLEVRQAPAPLAPRIRSALFP